MDNIGRSYMLITSRSQSVKSSLLSVVSRFAYLTKNLKNFNFYSWIFRDQFIFSCLTETTVLWRLITPSVDINILSGSSTASGRVYWKINLVIGLNNRPAISTLWIILLRMLNIFHVTEIFFLLNDVVFFLQWFHPQ